MDSAAAGELVPSSGPLFHETRLAVGGFLAPYTGNRRAGYACDLRAWFAWCAQVGLEVFTVRRLTSSWTPAGWRRRSTSPGHDRPTFVDRGRLLSLRRDRRLPPESPAEHVRRPKIDTESPTLRLDRMELGAFLAQAAAAGPVDHALACLIGLLGLRVAEACGIDVEHLGTGLDRRAGIGKRISPHSLRHSFITAALDAGVPLRDVHFAARHADLAPRPATSRPETTSTATPATS